MTVLLIVLGSIAMVLLIELIVKTIRSRDSGELWKVEVDRFMELDSIVLVKKGEKSIFVGSVKRHDPGHSVKLAAIKRRGQFEAYALNK